MEQGSHGVFYGTVIEAPCSNNTRYSRTPDTQMTRRRFPPAWQVVERPESFWVQDASGQTVGWFYFRDNPEMARHAGVLERDEAQRMAMNFARLPELLWRTDRG
jgi:hypothetical protein